MYARLLNLIESARAEHESLDARTDAHAVLMIEVGETLARAELIVRALVADES